MAFQEILSSLTAVLTRDTQQIAPSSGIENLSTTLATVKSHSANLSNAIDSLSLFLANNVTVKNDNFKVTISLNGTLKIKPLESAVNANAAVSGSSSSSVVPAIASVPTTVEKVSPSVVISQPQKIPQISQQPKQQIPAPPPPPQTQQPQPQTIPITIPIAPSQEPTITGPDYSKLKPPQNQIPFPTFSTFLDQYLRPITDTDLNFLSTDTDDQSAYVVPKKQVTTYKNWAQHDFSQPVVNTPANGGTSAEYMTETAYVYDKELDYVVQGDVYFGPLYERLMASLVDVGNGSVNDDDEDFEETYVPDEFEELEYGGTPKYEMEELEERVMKELKLLGLWEDGATVVGSNGNGNGFGGDGAGWDEDDEILRELRECQSDLRSLVEVNRFRKEKVLERAKEWMAYQEYLMVLEDVDKRLESAYNKRYLKNKKKGKVKSTVPVPTNDESIAILMKKRQLLISQFSSLLDSTRLWGSKERASIFKEREEKENAGIRSRYERIDMKDEEDDEEEDQYEEDEPDRKRRKMVV